jgi:hypothetical protein
MSPKERFLQTGAAKVHFELTATEPFQQAMDAALLQHVKNLALPTYDPEVAVANFNRILGASEFASVLMNLATKEDPAPLRSTPNLDHRTK